MPDDPAAIAAAVLADPQRTREVVASAFRAYAILCSADAEGKTPDGDAAVMSARSDLHAAIKLDSDALRQALNHDDADNARKAAQIYNDERGYVTPPTPTGDNTHRCASALGIETTITRSAGADGVPVLFVDTDPEVIPDGPQGPRMRILLNDADVYVGEPYQQEEQG